MSQLEHLQAEWNTLYKTTLPTKARAKDPAQPKWPVTLDHCFGRIVLDNAVGKDKPWTAMLKSPAYKNMSEAQLKDAIALGKDIESGKADLVELDEKSLSLRGKASKTDRKGNTTKVARPKKGKDESKDGIKDESKDEIKPDQGTKRKATANDGPPTEKTDKKRKVSSYFLPSPKSDRTTTPTEPAPDSCSPQHPEQDLTSPPSTTLRNPITDTPYPDLPPHELIAKSSITPFRKLVLSVLCQVPRGRYTTYQCMSDHISNISHKTCARAIGNAMRNNPFAPVVPCHRVLANDGRIGGFGGHWGEEGKFAQKKRSMLREEGVKFDGKGKVVGAPFRDFK